MTRYPRKAFTLVELLVVISIIALLLSILLPGLRRAMEISRRTMCASNQRSLTQVLHIYASGNDDVFPVPAWARTGGRDHEDSTMWAPGNMWIYTLAQAGELGHGIQSLRHDEGIWSCPSSEQTYLSDGDVVRAGHGIGIGMNDGYSSRLNPDQPPGAGFPRIAGADEERFFGSPIQLSRIRRPSETVLLADVEITWSIYTWRWANLRPVPNDLNSYSDRHMGGANFAFVDGSVTHVSNEDEQQKRYGIMRPKSLKYVYDNWSFD